MYYQLKFTRFNLIGEVAPIISFHVIVNRPLTWVAEWGCDFGKGMIKLESCMKLD
jgi:hypothetical protein